MSAGVSACEDAARTMVSVEGRGKVRVGMTGLMCVRGEHSMF